MENRGTSTPSENIVKVSPFLSENLLRAEYTGLMRKDHLILQLGSQQDWNWFNNGKHTRNICRKGNDMLFSTITNNNSIKVS